MNKIYKTFVKIAFVSMLLCGTFSVKAINTITIPTVDGVNITADVYFTDKKTAPIILLFHQARYSRGEYLETAKQFNQLGYNCIAPDLRSGGESNGVENQTHKRAIEKGLPTKYADALPDMEATVDYVFKNYPDNDIIVLGSSYTASLSLVLATKYKNLIGVMAFSPAEYFRLNDQTFEGMAYAVRCPVFITSAKKEIPRWLPIYEQLPEVFAFKFEPQKVNGVHGSKNLWKTSPDHAKYWEEVKKFLDNL